MFASSKFNEVEKSAIRNEIIKKEGRSFRIYDKYTVNPFKKKEYLQGKPNSMQDALDLLKGKEDSEFLEMISRANLEPVKKYTEPQSTNQEYGWITDPLIKKNFEDKRLHFNRSGCEITHYMDEYWKQKHNARGVGSSKPT